MTDNKNPFDIEPEKPKAEEKPVETKKEPAKAAPKKKSAPKKVEKLSFNEIDFGQYPLSAVSGQVTGVIKLNGAVPILEIALVGWVGEAPVSIAADQIEDVEKILADLRKAAKAAQK